MKFLLAAPLLLTIAFGIRLD